MCMNDWVDAQVYSRRVKGGGWDGDVARRILDPVASERTALLSKRKQTTAPPHHLPQPFSRVQKNSQSDLLDGKGSGTQSFFVFASWLPPLP